MKNPSASKHFMTLLIFKTDNIKYRLLKRVLVLLTIFVLSAFFPCNKIFSQTYNSSYISYSYLEVVQYSIKFSYSSSGSYSHYAPYVSYQSALATRQARYDYYHSIISTEYHKLKDLTLINKTNQATLQSYKNQRLNWVYNAGSTWDLGKSTNSTKIINYCCEIYSYPSIKNELSLLKSINTEIDRLKRDYPGEHHKTDRYKELGIVIDKLANCSASEISKLAWDYGLK